MTITGVSLKQTTKVTFDGVKATTVTVVNDTQVKATVPSGAVTGKIAIGSVVVAYRLCWESPILSSIFTNLFQP